MSDDQTTQDQPAQSEQPDQQDQQDQAAEANKTAKTNVGSELTDDESKIAEHSSRAHNERVGQEQ